jgi:2-phosphosulfolactate phosphatase
MEIKRLQLLEGAKKARGLAVIIDVFRAFTTDAYVMANGAKRIYPVESAEEAFELREKHPDWILMGEVEGVMIPGFDYGNSPADVENIDFSNKVVVQRTSAGTQGIINAKGAEERLLGSFVIAEATVEYIKNRDPDLVSLVAMGWGGREPSIEDELLAMYLEERLKGRSMDFKKIKGLIREDHEGEKFFDPSQPHFKEGDFHAAMDINRFDFALKIVDGTQPFIVKT